MIRVVHCIATLEIGGVERQLVELLTRPRPGFDDRVICLTRGGPLEEPLAAAGIPVEILGKTGRWDLRVLPRLVARLRAWRPDVLHTYLFTANFWGRLAAVGAGIPATIISVRCLDPVEMRGRYLWADRLLARRATLALAVSSAIERYLVARVGVPPSRVCVVRNAKDPDRYPPEEGRERLRDELSMAPGQALVTLVGRLHPQKGQDLLVAAAPLVLQRAPQTRFLLLGEGDWETEVRAMIAAAGLGDRARMIPRREDVAAVYAASDIVVLPSRFEGLPNVVVEAMAAARPVVATAIPGTDEVVVPGETGLLVPPEDPEALAEALLEMLRDPEKARAMGAAGRRRFLQELTFERAAECIGRLHRQAAGLR